LARRIDIGKGATKRKHWDNAFGAHAYGRPVCRVKMLASFLRCLGSRRRGVFHSAKTDHRSIEMRHGRIGNESALREATQIRTLISDLDRVVQCLNCDIATEEEHAGVFDRSDVTYSLLAGMLAARRDNLVDTIAALAIRLAAIEASLLEPVAA
jgi:hypothetical protein